jgi:UDP-glucose 4-epimerase
VSRVLITGGAGFIGSNLADFLVSEGNEVSVIDNFKTGRKEFLEHFPGDVIEADLLSNREVLAQALKGKDVVYHLAANADVRDGWSHPRLDHEQNIVVTLNVLEEATSAGVKEFVFSSTGSVYGETAVIPTPENAPFPIQTSLYGASKTSAEAFIQSYAEANRIKATIFRFVSVLGPRYTHGHVIDFARQLEADQSKLQVLGDGRQRKSYMHVKDCVRAVSHLRGPANCEIFNLGRNEYCEVNDSIGWILSVMGLDPVISYSGGDRGWIGDNPFIWLDTQKARSFGWEAAITIEESVKETVQWLLAHEAFSK